MSLLEAAELSANDGAEVVDRAGKIWGRYGDVPVLLTGPEGHWMIFKALDISLRGGHVFVEELGSPIEMRPKFD